MKYLVDEESEIYMTSSQISWMIAIIELGNLISPLPAGVIADKWGRKPSILLTGPMFALTWIVILFTTSYTIICIMRVIQGITMGFVFTVVPLYLGEIASPSRRGAISGLFSTAWFFGYLFEYCVGPYVSYKLFSALTATLPVIFVLLFILQPESPYFLLMKGKQDEAFAALVWLRGGSSQENIQKELEEMKQSVQVDLKNPSKLNDVIESPADRRALLIIILIGVVRMLSGGIAIMSYSTQLFTESGSVYVSPDVLTIIMGLAMLFGGFVNTFFVDSLGRRPLIFVSCIGSFFSLILVGTYFFVESKITPDIVRYSWIVPLAIVIYCICSVGISSVSMTYTSELFTSKTRGMASSISAINLTIGSFICIKLYQIVGDNYSLYTVYWFYSMICFVGFILLYVLAPETKGKTFSQIRTELCNVTSQNDKTISIVNPEKSVDNGTVNDAYI